MFAIASGEATGSSLWWGVYWEGTALTSSLAVLVGVESGHARQWAAAKRVALSMNRESDLGTSCTQHRWSSEMVMQSCGDVGMGQKSDKKLHPCRFLGIMDPRGSVLRSV